MNIFTANNQRKSRLEVSTAYNFQKCIDLRPFISPLLCAERVKIAVVNTLLVVYYRYEKIIARNQSLLEGCRQADNGAGSQH